MPCNIIKCLQFIWKLGNWQDFSAQSSKELLWIDLKIGHQDSNSSNGRQGDNALNGRQGDNALSFHVVPGIPPSGTLEILVVTYNLLGIQHPLSDYQLGFQSLVSRDGL